MNCIFCCIFYDEIHIKMFYLLLESIFIYGNIDDNTDILIYTTTPYMNIIKDSHLFNNKIKFEINDNYINNINITPKLDVFNLQSIYNYEKILYLNNNVIVKDNINILFNSVFQDILYVFEEGNIKTDHYDLYGKSLFTNEINNYEDTSAFTTNILLFNNCYKIQHLFSKINEDINNRSEKFILHDQPYIVYNAFKYKLFDNKLLKKFISIDNYIHSDNIIHYFAGNPNNNSHKFSNMTIFLNDLKDCTINYNIIQTKNYINNNLLPIINDTNENLEGNIFMTHNTKEYTNTYINKAKNISNLVLNKNIKNVMEIGFNAGFSTLLMLISNPNINITCFDLGEYSYTLPCYQKLKESFGDRINIIIGDSTQTLQTISNTFDLIHIDGGHTINIAASDIIQSYRLSNKRTILIMDDYDFYNLHGLWDFYVEQFNLKNLNINLYESIHHDIKYV
jgi:predicted O-methyltransferase YrrM